ncbi:MAG: hypothetical protein LBT59_28275 [Clostridiales bacterium]|jgi:hypothetical protein|nr:hypothetical protein [Clostridiales bacterium]
MIKKIFGMLSLFIAIASLSACKGAAANKTADSPNGANAAQASQPPSTSSDADDIEVGDDIDIDEDYDIDGDEIDPNSEDLPEWNGLDFGPNLEYSGDPEAAEGALAAFNDMKDKGLITDYNDSIEYWMTLENTQVINFEECYVYLVDDFDATMSFAYAAQSGNVYYIGNEGWMSSDTLLPVPDGADIRETYEFQDGIDSATLFLIGTMPGNVRFTILADNRSSTGEVEGHVDIDDAGNGSWNDPFGHGSLEFEYDSESQTITVDDNTDGYFSGIGVSFDGAYIREDGTE